MIQYSKMPLFIFIASVLIIFSASTRADVVECINEAGSVLYTDVPCQAAADAERAKGVPVVSLITPSVAKASPTEQDQATAQPVKVAPARGLSLDVATLKAAREAMVSIDRAASLSRQQALAQIKTYR